MGPCRAQFIAAIGCCKLEYVTIWPAITDFNSISVVDWLTCGLHFRNVDLSSLPPNSMVSQLLQAHCSNQQSTSKMNNGSQAQEGIDGGSVGGGGLAVSRAWDRDSLVCSTWRLVRLFTLCSWKKIVTSRAICSLSWSWGKRLGISMKVPKRNGWWHSFIVHFRRHKSRPLATKRNPKDHLIFDQQSTEPAVSTN